MRTSEISFTRFIPKQQERTYQELPFRVPEGVCRVDIAYRYERFRKCREQNGILRSREINIVDLALRDAQGTYLGASGAGKEQIFVSGWDSTPGYCKVNPVAGQWTIIAGAYKICDPGVEVHYSVTFTYGERQLLLGDTHVHTTASDGELSAETVVRTARAADLDFVFLTDHNNYAQNLSLPEVSGITVLPGLEWTHYEGHAGMLGVVRPLENPFCVNPTVQTGNILAEARNKGALLVLNHPFCPACGWHFPLEDEQFDLVEAINGGTDPGANEACIRWWHRQLCLGKRWRIIGGSDFHRLEPGRCIGQPAMAVYALSRSPQDILSALRRGNSYLLAWPQGPVLRLEAAGALLGECVPRGTETTVALEKLHEGDGIRLITDTDVEEIPCDRNTIALTLHRQYSHARFVRVEVYRAGQRILLSNPLFFT